jgi:hypothetical protein
MQEMNHHAAVNAVEAPNQQRRDGGADALAVLCQPAALAFDVTFERKLERCRHAAQLAQHQNDTRDQE